jgi:hypothetical protein
MEQEEEGLEAAGSTHRHNKNNTQNIPLCASSRHMSLTGKAHSFLLRGCFGIRRPEVDPNCASLLIHTHISRHIYHKETFSIHS